MPVTELNHYFVRANNLERSKRFYIEVLGFEVMPRPDFPFPGYWLGVGGKVQVHMGPHGIPDSELYYLGSPPASATNNTGTVAGGAGAESYASMPRTKDLEPAHRLDGQAVENPLQ
jgi:catechol 2,3-dioxygenase-like lactoylglutathione lyase family enzyme